MPRKLSTILLLAVALLSLGAVAGCGNEEKELHTEEGEPLELGELRYNVQITRLLNPDVVGDDEYLKGLKRPPRGTDYLGVFIRIQNEGEEADRIPFSFPIRSSRDETFQPIKTDNPLALQLGAEIPAGGEIPDFDTAARNGPIKGSMLLYLIDEGATENRPFELEIPGPDGKTGSIELDL